MSSAVSGILWDSRVAPQLLCRLILVFNLCGSGTNSEAHSVRTFPERVKSQKRTVLQSGDHCPMAVHMERGLREKLCCLPAWLLLDYRVELEARIKYLENVEYGELA